MTRKFWATLIVCLVVLGVTNYFAGMFQQNTLSGVLATVVPALSVALLNRKKKK